MSNSLKWTTISNGTHKRAVTHFGVTYDVTKDVNTGRWSVLCNDPSHHDAILLAEGKTFLQAVKAANDDYNTFGGR